MKRKLNFLILAFVMILSLVQTNGTKVYAYGIDYDYIDNVLAEVGYYPYFDDSQTIMEDTFQYVGGFNFGMGTYATYLAAESSGIYTIVPMNQTIFTESAYNLMVAMSTLTRKEDEDDVSFMARAKAELNKAWDSGINRKLDIYMRSGDTFTIAAKNSNPAAATFINIAGDNLRFVDLNDSQVTEARIYAESKDNLGEYVFANCPNLKNIEVEYMNLEDSKMVFPYAFAYSCKSLKYLTYPQNVKYVFDKYSFANCSALIHWTGLGVHGATENWNNTTSSDYYEFKDYSFSGCNSITHTDFVAPTVILNDYAFGKSGLSYIGFFDYVYSEDNENKNLAAYTEYAKKLVASGNIADKAFDGVTATRIYVGHKNIYDALNSYADGELFSRTLCVANVSIKFDKGDSDSGKMEDTIIRYDDDVYTLENQYKKTGYDFVGWENGNKATMPDTYNALHNGIDWISVFSNGDAPATKLPENTYRDGTVIKPTWKATEYAVRYVLNGALAEDNPNPDKHIYGETITALKDIKRVGYDFKGWYEDEKFTVEFGGIPANDTNEHTYYAKWEKHKIKITYILDGGKNHPDNPEEIADNAGKLYLKEPTKEGYDFDGWTAYEGAESITYIMPSNGDITVTAHWKPHAYTIHYELNGGKFIEEPETEHIFGKVTYLMIPPVKDKYKFIGWYSDAAYKNRVYDIASDFAGDITLYAKWGETVAVLEKPTMTGYRFLGWVDKSGKNIPETELLSDHKDNIFSNWLDIRWITSKKGSMTYVRTLKSCYDWYSKKEKKGDKDSFTEETQDGAVQIYGTADGYVTKGNIRLNISGNIKSLELKKNGKKVDIPKSYFEEGKKSGDIYLYGYPITKSGLYVLSVSSPAATKTITFMKDGSKPTVKGIAKETTVTKSKLEKRVKKTKKTVKKKGNTVTTTKKKGKKKTVTKVRTTSFSVTQTRRFYVNKKTDKTEKKTVTKIHTAEITWKDSLAGISTVYINKKQLSNRKVKKGKYTFSKAGTYKVEVYDYLGNHYSQKIVIDKENSDVKLPTLNVKNDKTYYAPCKLVAKDKSGIASIRVTDWHGFTKTYKKSSYTFKTSGTYKIRVTDKSGNYKDIKIKIVKKKKY